jgi:hypothetical protein
MSERAPDPHHSRSPIWRVVAFGSDDGPCARGVDELARSNGDANMGRASTRRREEHEITGSNVTRADAAAEGVLFGHRPRHLQTVALEHIPHQATAIEAALRLVPAKPVADTLQADGRLNQGPRLIG